MQRTILLSSVLLTTAMQAEEAKRPNIIFIMADDLGYSELGCYGNTFNETPNLDQMAVDGVRFTHAHTAASLSSPTRAALMTGQYPYRVGIVDYLRGNSDPMRTDVPTVAETLRNNGYHTGIIGKWHLTGYYLSNAKQQVLPDERGFDEMIVSENQYIADGSYFHPYHFNKTVEKVLQGEKEFLVDRMNYEAIEFIKRNKEEPFFLYLSHYAVHTQLMGDPKTVGHFRKKAGAGTSAPSDNNKDDDPYTKYPSDYRASTNNPHLAAQLKHIDTGVGEILQCLRDNGLMENTLVIFTSDNGGATGVTTNAPLRGGKTSLYEGGTRVPMIFYGHGIEKSPKTIDQRITSMDFFPTFCELAQADVPEQACDGISIIPLLNNKNPEERDFFWYYPPSVKETSSSRRIEASVISGNYKLIEGYSYDGYRLSVIKHELFDLEKDPGESTEISADNPEITVLLSNKISRWRNKIDAERPMEKNQIIHISPDGKGDGTSWQKAANIEQGIQIARNIPAHEIWMKTGTYNITTSINFDSLFIYGGFDGNEEKLDERNWNKNPTIIDGNNMVSPFRNTTGDARSGDFIASLIDGLIIQNGVNPSEENGGGMLINNGAFVRNCIFRNNTTQNEKNGAAIHCHSGNCVIENTLFVNNTSSGNGGALQVGGGTTATIRNCTFANNKAEKPGGAIGTGTNSSNLTLINSIAFNNLYGQAYSSYGQNSDINAGGEILSNYSAVESTSTKFTNGDATGHLSLSRTNTPLFGSPSAVIGKGTTQAEIDAINTSSYILSAGSPCIDAGLNYEAMDIRLDLKFTGRIQGFSVDMGAYEFESESNLFTTFDPGCNINVFVAENELYISGAKRGSTAYIYNLKGNIVTSQYIKNEKEYSMITLKERGIYFVVVDNQAVKFKY